MNKEKILIIDDNEGQRAAMQYLLEKENYTVITAHDGPVGMMLLNEHDDIKVVIIDLVMVGLSGVDILKLIKERVFPLRRIVITAHNEELQYKEAQTLKVFAYLNKPVSKQTLLFSVKEAVIDLYANSLGNHKATVTQLEELGKSTAGFAHFVGNKVGVIPNYIEAIKEDFKKIPPTVQSKLDQIKENSRQILKLKQNLLSPFSPRFFEDINIHQIIDESLLAIDFPENIELIKNYEIKEPVVEINGAELQKVFASLIDNAVDAMQNSETKQITISTSIGDNKSVKIIIKDAGCGIKEDDKLKIFRPFYSTKLEENHGIGLFSARNTLVKFNGTIRFQSEEEKGTSFIINLPLKV